eukprot:jgi/Mesvir1/12578/Mv25201-RA.1
MRWPDARWHERIGGGEVAIANHRMGALGHLTMGTLPHGHTDGRGPRRDTGVVISKDDPALDRQKENRVNKVVVPCAPCVHTTEKRVIDSRRIRSVNASHTKVRSQ